MVEAAGPRPGTSARRRGRMACSNDRALLKMEGLTNREIASTLGSALPGRSVATRADPDDPQTAPRRIMGDLECRPVSLLGAPSQTGFGPPIPATQKPRRVERSRQILDQPDAPARVRTDSPSVARGLVSHHRPSRSDGPHPAGPGPIRWSRSRRVDVRGLRDRPYGRPGGVDHLQFRGCMLVHEASRTTACPASGVWFGMIRGLLRIKTQSRDFCRTNVSEDCKCVCNPRWPIPGPRQNNALSFPVTGFDNQATALAARFLGFLRSIR